MRKILILLALAVLTTANTGCSARFRNWLHRGSPCGTTTIAPAIAPAMMGAPVALGTPVAVPQVAPAMVPAMAPAPRQQVVVPQPIFCCPQPVPCCPPCEYDPCQTGLVSGWPGGYLEGNMMAPYECGPITNYEEGYLVPGSETPVDSDSYEADPGPVQEN